MKINYLLCKKGARRLDNPQIRFERLLVAFWLLLGCWKLLINARTTLIYLTMQVNKELKVF